MGPKVCEHVWPTSQRRSASVRPQPRPMKRPLHKVPVGASVHQLSTNSGAQYRAVQIANPTSRANAGGACVRTPLDHSVNGHKLQQSFREGGAYVSTGHIRRDERSRIRSGVSRSGNPRTPRREQLSRATSVRQGPSYRCSRRAVSRAHRKPPPYPKISESCPAAQDSPAAPVPPPKSVTCLPSNPPDPSQICALTPMGGPPASTTSHHK
jgi:hypothetical protein